MVKIQKWVKDLCYGNILDDEYINLQDNSYYECEHKYTSRGVCGETDCEHCFSQSVAANKYAVERWSPRNYVNPIDVKRGSNYEYWFIYDNVECNHTYKKSPKCFIIQNSRCTYCNETGTKNFCTDATCEKCYERSFESCEKSEYWVAEKNTVAYLKDQKRSKGIKGKKVLLLEGDENELISPRFISRGNDRKFWFKCENIHMFEASPNHITNGNTWCPSCKSNQGEQEILKYLHKNYKDYSIAVEQRYRWCINKRPLPYDFVIEDLKIIIELDGIQHFDQTWIWKSPAEQQRTDLYKMEKANEHSYTVIRLLQSDVHSRKNKKNLNLWKDKLKSSIHVYDDPSRVYISIDDKYNCFEETEHTIYVK
jgi:Marseilleviridae restriction endonuclease